MQDTTRPRVFITGGCGFLGSYLCSLLAPDCDLAVYDNLSPRIHCGTPSNLARTRAVSARVFVGDIRDASGLFDALDAFRPDTVVHLAAETGTGESHDRPAHYCEVNVGGTAHLVEAMRATGTVRRVVLASTRAVYGEGAYVDAGGAPARPVPRSEIAMSAGDFAVRDATGQRLRPCTTTAAQPAAPVSVYASSKLMQEHLLAQSLWGSPVTLAILRFQNVYGPGQSLRNPYTGVLSHFAARIAQGQPLELYEDGAITRDFVHVTDATDALARAVRGRESFTLPLDIGSGQPVTLAEVADLMLRLSGLSPRLARVSGRFRPGDIRYAVTDPQAARAALGWRPQWTLRDGLADLLGQGRKGLAA